MKAVGGLGALLVAGLAAAAPAPAGSEPMRGGDPRLRTVMYSPDVVLDVPVRRGQITQIVLGADEVLVGTPMSGRGANCAEETHAWCIAQQGRDLFVKPKTGATTNNLVVTTDRRRYAFELRAIETGGVALMRLTVLGPPPASVTAPAALAVAVAAAPPTLPPLTARELIETRWQVKPLVRNTYYSVATGNNSDDIVPVMVFDDGTQTYFGFPNNRPLPTIFQTAPDGSEEMVNARMGADDLLVADRVGRRFVLRLGDSVAAIINEAFDLDGVAPKDGTTVPGVARVVRAAGAAAVARPIP